MNENQKPVIWTVVIASVILLIALIFVASSINSSIALNNQALSNIEFPTAAAIAGLITIPEIVQPEFPDYMLSEDEYEENLMEDKAEELALDKVDMSKSFRNLIQTALNDSNEKVENYKDIEEIYSVKVKDVNVTGETAVVEIEFKVKYFNEGEFDEDEEELERAKLLVTINVEGLVFDDDFEDAESEVSEFEVIRIYEN